MSEDSRKIDSVDNVAVSSKVLANLFGLTDRRIRQLADEGVLTKQGRGRYNLSENVRLYISFLKASNELKEDKDENKIDYEKEHALLERARREKVELELALMRGKMHLSEDVEKVMNDMLANFRAKVLAMPTKIAPMLVHRNDVIEIQNMIQDEVFENLQELSAYDPKDFYSDQYIEIDELEELGDVIGQSTENTR